MCELVEMSGFEISPMWPHEGFLWDSCIGFSFRPVARCSRWSHIITHPSPAHACLQPQAHFHCHNPALKLRRSDPCNLFPCDWLLCRPQRGEEEEEEEKGRTWAERQFNMTKPVSPLCRSSWSSSLFPHSLDPRSPFMSSSWPLQVHFSPLMQIDLPPPSYLRAVSSTAEYALKNRGLWMLPVTLD